MRRFVVLALAATLVSYCGTAPRATVQQHDAASSEETAKDESIEITAAVAGAAVVLCYIVPKVTPKLKANNLNCRGLIKNGAQKTGTALKKIGNTITATGRKVGQKIKNLTKKTDDAAKNTDDVVDDAAKNSGDQS